jgi:hypothetical protein
MKRTSSWPASSRAFAAAAESLPEIPTSLSFVRARRRGPAPTHPHPASPTRCGSKLSLVSKSLNWSAPYWRPAGVLIETAKPSAASLRANITASMTLERMSAVR